MTIEPIAESFSEENLLKQIAHAIDDKKGDNIMIYDMRAEGGYIGIHIVITALSDLHIKNLTKEAIDKALEHNVKLVYPNQPNFESGWVILDFGFFVVHILTLEKREFYKLDAQFGKGKPMDWQN